MIKILKLLISFKISFILKFEFKARLLADFHED